MGNNLIITNSWVTVPDSGITVRSASSGYDKQNVMDYWHGRQRFRAGDLIKSDTNPLMVIDFGAAQSIVAVALLGVNFDKTRIRGHASDLGTNWSTSSWNSGSDKAVSLNKTVNRYNLFLPLTAFSYRYFAIMTPAAAGAVGDYTTYWEICKVVLLTVATPLTINMDYPFQRKGPKPYKDISLLHGGGERVELGKAKRYEATITFGKRPETDEAELWTLDALDNAQPVLLYENLGDDSAVFLVLRDTDYEGTLTQHGIVEGNSIQVRECI